MQLSRRRFENSSNLPRNHHGIIGGNWGCQVGGSVIKRQWWRQVASIVFVLIMVAYQVHAMQEQALRLRQFPSFPHVDSVHENNYNLNHENHKNNSFDQAVANYSRAIVTIRTLEPTTTSLHHEADPMTMKKLQRAGLDPTSTLNPETLRRIPKWNKIESVLGPTSPHIVGLETCADFQKIVENGERYIGVSGFFNSGTNLLAYLLETNCQFKHVHGEALWAVPWGKHSLAMRRDVQVVEGYEDYNKTLVLPVVIVRNPFEVLESMCRNSYSVHYKEDVNSTCPHMVDHSNGKLLSVRVGKNKPRTKYRSVAHYWNEWHNGHVHEFPHPRIIVRLEDLTVHPTETVQAICECVGGTVSEDFTYLLTSAKEGMGHGEESEKNGLVEAWIRLGRAIPFPSQDYKALKKHLDHDLMRLFHYVPPPRAEI